MLLDMHSVFMSRYNYMPTCMYIEVEATHRQRMRGARLAERGCPMSTSYNPPDDRDPGAGNDDTVPSAEPLGVHPSANDRHLGYWLRMVDALGRSGRGRHGHPFGPGFRPGSGRGFGSGFRPRFVPAIEVDDDARHCGEGRGHGRHGHCRQRNGERAYERGFDAGFARGRESAAS
jgi:hypothetical protein